MEHYENYPVLLAHHELGTDSVTATAVGDAHHLATDVERRDHDENSCRADVLQRAAYNADHEPEIVLPPATGHATLLGADFELIPLDELSARIAATLIVVYPPGIALVVPGERLSEGSAATAYLRLFEESDNVFPGFESEMQGVFPRRGDDDQLPRFTYVVRQGG